MKKVKKKTRRKRMKEGSETAWLEDGTGRGKWGKIK
jgi:hypothetical protein